MDDVIIEKLVKDNANNQTSSSVYAPLSDGVHFVFIKNDRSSDGTYISRLYQYTNTFQIGFGRAVGCFECKDVADEVHVVVEEEEVENKVEHLIFVVHGIGEALFTRPDMNLGTIIECANSMRNVSSNLLDGESELRKIMKEEGMEINGRFEYLPNQWHSVVHDEASAAALDRVTQKTLPIVRAIANQLFVDILFYMEPEHRLLMANKIASEGESQHSKNDCVPFF